MKTQQSASQRRRAFGSHSHITPVTVSLFLILFYAPFISNPLRAHGWNKGAALTTGLAIPTLWMVVGCRLIFVVPARFEKLNTAFEFVVFGVPVVGMFVIAAQELWGFVSHITR